MSKDDFKDKNTTIQQRGKKNLSIYDDLETGNILRQDQE